MTGIEVARIQQDIEFESWQEFWCFSLVLQHESWDDILQ
jgi:hypothetical protein